MPNTKQRILTTLRRNEPFLCHLATLTGDGRPWVRTMRGMIDDELVIRCPTFAGTKKIAQIQTDSEVHLTCGDTDPLNPGSYFQPGGFIDSQISTKIQEIKAKDLIQEILGST